MMRLLSGFPARNCLHNAITLRSCLLTEWMNERMRYRQVQFHCGAGKMVCESLRSQKKHEKKKKVEVKRWRYGGERPHCSYLVLNLPKWDILGEFLGRRGLNRESQVHVVDNFTLIFGYLTQWFLTFNLGYTLESLGIEPRHRYF